MKRKKLSLLMISALIVLLVACAPRTVPVSTPAPAPTLVAPATPAVQAITPEEAAWAQVVEAAKKEGKVTAYSFHFVAEVGQALAKSFRGRYGIQLEVVSGPGMTLIERIKSEHRAGKKIADFFTSAPSILLMAKGEGLLTSIPDLPVLSEQQVWVADPRYDPEGYMMVTNTQVYSPYINTSLVKRGDYPKSFRDLLTPRWKGKIIFPNPDTIPTPVYTYWVMTDRKILDKEYFRQLGRQDLRFVPTERDNLGTLARGEGEIAFTSANGVAGRLVAEGAPIQALGMEEGTILVLGSAFSMIKDRPHPNAARVFANWLLMPEGNKVYAEAQRVSPLRKDVPDFTPAAARPEVKRALVMTVQDEKELTRIMRDKELSSLLGR